MPFELDSLHRDVPDADLLADIQRVASQRGGSKLTWRAYSEAGSYGAETIRKRFGSWNVALGRAGLAVGKRWRVPEVELLENIGEVWTRLGRQPRRDDLAKHGSRFSSPTYAQRFGSWRRALEAFVGFANENDPIQQATRDRAASSRRSTPRQPWLRLRFKVMRRDNFACSRCGASPARRTGVELHVDHVVPWSKGAETALDNLATLCSKCNLGKSDLRSHEA